MDELLFEYMAAEHLGTALVVVAVAAIFAAVHRSERLRPARTTEDG